MKLKLQMVAVLLLLINSYQLNAQSQKTDNLTPWYGGVKIGMPLGVSSFSSVGTDKTSLGISGGIYGGYSINKIFSAEVSASFGNMRLNALSCSGDYWLGANGNSHLAPDRKSTRLNSSH